MNYQSFQVKAIGGTTTVVLPSLVVVGLLQSDDGATIADYSADANGVPVAETLAAMTSDQLVDLILSTNLGTTLLSQKAGVLS